MKVEENLYLYELLTHLEKAVNLYQENKLSPLQTACMMGQTHKLRRLIKRLERQQDVADSEELSSALYLAVGRGTPNILRMLLHMRGFYEPVAIYKARKMTQVILNPECFELLQNYLPPKYMSMFIRPLLGPNVFLPGNKLDACQLLFMQCNLHPAYIALNLSKYGLFDLRRELRKAFELQAIVEWGKSYKRKELIALKSYYFGMILQDLNECAAKSATEADALREYVCMVHDRLYNGKNYIQHTVRNLVQNFPFPESELLQKLKLKLLKHNYCAQTLWILRNTLNGGNLQEMDPTLLCNCCSDDYIKITCGGCSLKYCSETCRDYHKFFHVQVCEEA